MPEEPAGGHRSRILDRFLRRFFEDQDRGEVGSLTHYQALFPDQDELIERSYAALVEEPARGLPERAALTPGKTLGPYRIERQLGLGGQSTVYLARDTRAERRVALKVLHRRGGGEGDASVRRMQREAEAAASIQHPGVCPIFDVQVEGPIPYLAMPYLEGPTLAECIQSKSAPIGDLRATVRTIAALAEALATAHAAGIVHRDVKPDNVILTEQGPILLDLGVARTDESDLTQTGMLVGTLPYMAPEQLEGLREVDGRTDIYGLGATLFECLTSQLPFDAPTQQHLTRAILNEDPPDVRGIVPSASTDLAIVVNTALAKDARHRYQSARAFADDLRRVLEHRTITARPVTSVVRFARWCQRNPGLAITTSSAFAALALGLAAALVLLERVRGEERATKVALEQKEEALGERQAALDEVQQLADHRRLADLIADEAGLWPVRAAVAPAMASWSKRADTLLERLPEHRATLERLNSHATPESPTPVDEQDITALWHAEALADLIQQLEAFSNLTREVRGREEIARSIDRRSLADPAQEWERARRGVANDPRYEGFSLAPTVGLVPIGFDPESGLLELAHLESGEPPERDEQGFLRLEPESGLVFVLIPGGTFDMGAFPPDSEHTLGSPNVDPFSRSMAAPVHTIELSPFLLSKYELSQGQWRRLTGENPAYFQGEVLKEVTDRDPLLPVEHVSWDRCQVLFERRTLGFPTEAQWEFACRAGTTSVWYTGDDEVDLIDFENLCDEGSARYRRQDVPFIRGMDDGAVTSSLIGSYFPNPFGLHDMTGNVMEWCADYFGPYGLPTRPGDGLRDVAPVPVRVVRGGSFRDLGAGGTSAARHNGPPDIINPVVGVRPIFRPDP